MATTFDQLINNATTTVASSYTAGSGSLVLTSGSSFPSSGPFRVTTYTGSGATLVIKSILRITARSSNTLTVSGAIEGSTDVNLASGVNVSLLSTAGHLKDAYDAINTVENGAVFASSTIGSPITKTVNNIETSGLTVTFTTSAAHGFVVGQVVRVSGLTNSAFNDTYLVKSVPTSTTFTSGTYNALSSTADNGTATANPHTTPLYSISNFASNAIMTVKPYSGGTLTASDANMINYPYDYKNYGFVFGTMVVPWMSYTLAAGQVHCYSRIASRQSYVGGTAYDACSIDMGVNANGGNIKFWVGGNYNGGSMINPFNINHDGTMDFPGGGEGLNVSTTAPYIYAGYSTNRDSSTRVHLCGQGGKIPLVLENSPFHAIDVFRIKDSSGAVVISSNYEHKFTIGSSTVGSGQTNCLTLSTSRPALVCQAITSQTSNLQEWQNSTATPLSFVNVDGVMSGIGFASSIRTVTSNATLGSSDSTLLANAASGAIAVTVPSASTVPAGRIFTIKKIDSSGNAISFSMTGGQTIDGTTSNLTAQYQAITIQSNGSTWYIIGKV